jgi:hypothetical protein
MPNITFTSVTAIGPADDLAKLAGLLAHEEWSSESLCPIPPFAEGGKTWYGNPELQAKEEAKHKAYFKKYGIESEYDFVNEIWGSKWGITSLDKSNINYTPGATELFVYWESAWSPAYGLLYLLARLFPTIEFSFSSTDECCCYEPHTITLKNPQPIINAIAIEEDVCTNALQKKTVLDEQAEHYAYFQQDMAMVLVKRDNKDVLISRDDATEEELNDPDLEEETEDGPKEKIPMYIGLTMLKAEWYINGWMSAHDSMDAKYEQLRPAPNDWTK